MYIQYSGDIKKISIFYWRLRRHFRFLVRHLNFRRAVNAIIFFAEMKFKKVYLRSYPPYIRIETSPYCNLRCPGCLLGETFYNEANPEHRDAGFMSYDLFVDSVKDFVPYLLKINLYDEGEPLLNKNILKMIKYLSSNNVATNISTNFSLNLSEEKLNEIVDCGLEQIVICLDGSTQETYSKYRVGGDLNKVLQNLKKLSEINYNKKGKLKIDVQFIDFDDDEKERTAVYNLVKDLKIWRLSIIQGSSRKGRSGLKFTGTPDERRAKGCYELWTSVIINSKGELGTCDYGEDNGIQNIGEARNYKKDNLRNHPVLVELRQSFKYPDVPLNEICCHCCEYLKK